MIMMNEVGELTEKNKVFVAVCHALLKWLFSVMAQCPFMPQLMPNTSL